MIWPFCWRSTLEHERNQQHDIREHDRRHIKLLREMLTEAKGERLALQERVSGLTDTLVSMKRDGYEPQLFPTVEAPKEIDLPAEVWAAIGEVSEKGTEEYQACVDYALEHLDGTHTHAEIVERILQGQEVDV